MSALNNHNFLTLERPQLHVHVHVHVRVGVETVTKSTAQNTLRLLVLSTQQTRLAKME